MTVTTEPTHPGEFLLNEGEGTISRESVNLLTGENLVSGTILGKITQGSISVGDVTFAGTGDGTCTKASTAYGAGAYDGDYIAVCVEQNASGGVFEVLRPDGTSDGFASVGSAYDGQVKFTLAIGTASVGNVTFAGTGDGTCTKASPAFGSGVHSGNYTASCIEANPSGGVFAVLRPDGTSDGLASVGSAYDGQVKFTLAIGSATVGSVTFAGAGNGTCTKASPAFGAGVHSGNYTAVCIEKVADFGTFQIVRPDGTADGFATGGTAYTGQVKFTIAAGDTDFEPGDTFTVPVTLKSFAPGDTFTLPVTLKSFAPGDTFTLPVGVAIGSGKYKAYDKDNTDGSEVAAGILFAATDATLGDQLAVAIVRHAEVIEALLTGFDETARPQLAAVSVIAR